MSKKIEVWDIDLLKIIVTMHDLCVESYSIRDIRECRDLIANYRTKVADICTRYLDPQKTVDNSQ